MRRPSVEQIPAPLRAVAREIATRLGAAGQRGWIVGGAVRDLALGSVPRELDMASAATPELIERLFARTIGVGRAFGTVIVHLRGIDVELTTYRADQGYSDGRRPDSVRFSTTLEEDSARRDFTCNALYLDPLTDELADPRGGWADLQARCLRCIGVPRERFREDALRLARMARLAGSLAFRVDPPTLEAAREEAAGLARVSVERRLGELTLVFGKPGSPRALELLASTGLLRHLVPGVDTLQGPASSFEQATSLRLAALEALGEVPGAALGFALLLEPDPAEGAGGEAALARARDVLESLRPARSLRTQVLELLQLQRQAEGLVARGLGSRAERVRLKRAPLWPQAERLLRAWQRARRASPQRLEQLSGLLAQLPDEQLHPAPLISSADLAQSGLPRGKLWSQVLAEAEAAQLDLVLQDREQALRWLAERVAELR